MEQCISCGRESEELVNIEGEFMMGRHKVCPACRKKFSGLNQEADRLLTTASKEATCLGCGAPMIKLQDNKHHLYCRECTNSIFRQYLTHRN